MMRWKTDLDRCIGISPEEKKRWLAIKAGDVLETPTGSLRLVRSVSGPNPRSRMTPLRKTHVYLTIAHPSWTGRCYTLYNLGEMICMGWKLLKTRVDVNDQFNELFLEDTKTGPRPWNFEARDVAGIP